MTDDRRQTTDSIDIAKFISSFLVVGIHTNLFISVSQSFNNYFINAFCRLAVYFYFIASAYFFFSGLKFNNGKIAKDQENLQRLKKYTIRISLLYLIWSAIYFVWYALGGLQEGWLSIFDIAWYGINAVLSSSYYHLWFLISLIYAIPIMYFALRHIKAKHLIIVSMCLYVIGLVYGSYSFAFGNHLPLIGVWKAISNRWPRIITVIFNVIPICSIVLINPKVLKNKIVVYLASLLFIILFSLEFVFINHLSPSTVSSYLVLTIPATTLLFYAIKNTKAKTKYSKMFRKLSTLIYCIHPLCISHLLLQGQTGQFLQKGHATV